VRLIQVAVPSREHVEAYQSFRSQADELIGRIQGAFATPRWVPVHWLYRTLSREELVALYRAADVMLVTPVRDGMNLVAKEFVASRSDEDGVLVLSEFAGAASELAEAVFVNPFDLDGSADAFLRALDMPEDERRTRMRSLRRRVLRNDVHRWVRSFRAALSACADDAERARRVALTPPDVLAELLARLVKAEHLVLLLDYDGTLVPFARAPELARPDEEVLELLGRLAALPRTRVHVVSGRTRETLAGWLGHLPLHLHAEHGLWSREAGASEWSGGYGGAAEWRAQAQAILEDFAANTPGSLVEEKTAGLAWHWRASDPELGARQARELQLHLTELLANSPVEILPGSKVIELRPHGVNKGRVVEHALGGAPPGTAVLAIGDDRTDEDLFAALPAHAIAIHVGARASRAPYRLAGVVETRRLLRDLAAARG
jgi:trehalose 6-phosphate synthase/phosphatase